MHTGDDLFLETSEAAKIQSLDPKTFLAILSGTFDFFILSVRFPMRNQLLFKL